MTLLGATTGADIRDPALLRAGRFDRRNGERITITRDGKAVAELRPVPARRLSAAAVLERFRHLPPIDPERFRSDIDAVIDQSL